jgi:hypothetical protein
LDIATLYRKPTTRAVSIAAAAIAAAHWIVNNQAQMTRTATRQRTAPAWVTAPTPTIPPVITWVVDRHPQHGRQKQRKRAACFGAEAMHRAEISKAHPDDNRATKTSSTVRTST